MPVRRSRIAPQRGAALLLLLALLGTGSALLFMAAFQPHNSDRFNEQQTYIALAEARDALIGFAAQHGRLPRPATSALEGQENPQPCDTAARCSGFIPWVTLGINGTDRWGKLLRYSVTPSFTVLPLRATSVGGDKTVSGRDQRGFFFYLAGQQGCALYAQCPPAVLYSSGKHNPGTSMQGIFMASPDDSNVDERQNQFTSNDFVSRPRSTANDVPGGEFDDLVIWLPVQQLYERMRAARSLK